MSYVFDLFDRAPKNRFAPRHAIHHDAVEGLSSTGGTEQLDAQDGEACGIGELLIRGTANFGARARDANEKWNETFGGFLNKRNHQLEGVIPTFPEQEKSKTDPRAQKETTPTTRGTPAPHLSAT